jgi:hypothetical protein
MHNGKDRYMQNFIHLYVFLIKKYILMFISLLHTLQF